MNAVTFNRDFAQGLRRGRACQLVFVACAALAAVGCGDDAAVTGPMLAAGAGGGVPGTAGIGVAGMGTGVAGMGTGVAGMSTGVAGMSTGVAGRAGAGAAGAGAAGMGAAGGGTAGGGTAGGGTAGGGAAGMGAGGMGGGAATLTQVFDTFYRPYCAMCHGLAPSNAANGMLGMVRDKAGFYSAVVGKSSQSPGCMGKGMYVVPGQPAQSLLVQKLMASPPCGLQMPPTGSLDASQIQVLTDWITAGAKMD